MHVKTQFLSAMILLIFIVSCSSAPNHDQSKSIALASFAENDVNVSIHLDSDASGNHFLSATFTPPSDYHLYSKDIPITGVDGLGRPTLIELTTNSRMKAIGKLTESAKAQEPDFDPKELLVYPLGAVTLSIPIELPAGNSWVVDSVKVTFMACSGNGCKAPVMGRIVSVEIPGADVVITK